MTDADRFKLLHGPYSPPAVRPGDTVTCEYRDRDVVVGEMSGGPIPWPTARKRGRTGPILCGDLVRAVRTESEVAVAHWWGVGRELVYRWRKALGVGRVTGGTRRLQRDHHAEQQPHQHSDPVAAGKLGGAATGAKSRGKPPHPALVAGQTAAARRPRSAAWKAQKSAALKGRSINPAVRAWTAEEDALLGTAPDAEIAARLGRTPTAVGKRRWVLGRPACRPGTAGDA